MWASGTMAMPGINESTSIVKVMETFRGPACWSDFCHAPVLLMMGFSDHDHDAWFALQPGLVEGYHVVTARQFSCSVQSR